MRVFAPLVFFCLFARAVLAHEFWIAPEAYTVEPGGQIKAGLFVGSEFNGAPQSYFPQRFARFDVRMGESLVPVEGRIGDFPALNAPAPAEGLAVVIHQTKGDSLRYKTRELFENFVAHKDLGDVLERHAARGLPELEFREAYTRYAKSLVAVGDGAGADRAEGLLIEIVALANPYADDVSGGLPVRVLYDGVPRQDAQVEVFERTSEEDVRIFKVRTDADGKAIVPLVSGAEYLVDSVIMEDTGNDDPKAGPVWHSAWASLTFRAP